MVATMPAMVDAPARRRMITRSSTHPMAGATTNRHSTRASHGFSPSPPPKKASPPDEVEVICQ
jgi:hypothetical protein